MCLLQLAGISRVIILENGRQKQALLGKKWSEKMSFLNSTKFTKNSNTFCFLKCWSFISIYQKPKLILSLAQLIVSRIFCTTLKIYLRLCAYVMTLINSLIKNQQQIFRFFKFLFELPFWAKLGCLNSIHSDDARFVCDSVSVIDSTDCELYQT